MNEIFLIILWLATTRGQIEEYISTTSSKTTTKDLQEIFSLLDELISSN